jgi:hypothetical protein
MPSLDLTPVLTAIKGNSTAILNELGSETYGLAAIKNAVDTIEGKLSSFMADADLRFTEMKGVSKNWLSSSLTHDFSMP